MALQIRDSGTLRTVTDLTIRQAGVSRRLLELKVMDGGVLRTVAKFAPPLSASLSPIAVSGSVASSFADPATTNPTTASPNGGRAPFFYQWVRISGAAAAASSPNTASTRFSAAVAPGQTVSAVFQVTITDAADQTATAQVSATFTNQGGSGGIDQ